MAESLGSPPATGTPTPTVPNSVTSFTAAFAFATVASTPNTPVINLSWTAPATGATPTSYNVWRGTATGAETLYASGVTPTNYQDTTVSNITTYFYYVVAVNTQGSATSLSAASSEISQKTACAAPTNLNLTIGDGQLSGTFTGSAGATGYNVYRKLQSAGSYSGPTLTNIQTTSFTLTGLTDGLAYNVYVTALD